MFRVFVSSSKSSSVAFTVKRVITRQSRSYTLSIGVILQQLEGYCSNDHRVNLSLNVF